MKRIWIVCASLFLAAAIPAQLTHLWVDAANGSDNNPGTRARPFKTLTKGLTTLKANAVVHVLPGVYGPKTTGDFWDNVNKRSKVIQLNSYRNFHVVGADRDKCIVDFNGLGDQYWGFIQVRNPSQIKDDSVEVCNLTFRNVGSKSWACGPLHVHGWQDHHTNIHHNMYIDCNSAFIIWSGSDAAFHDNIIVSTVQGKGVSIRVRGENTRDGDRVYVYNNLVYNTRIGLEWSDGTNWTPNKTFVEKFIYNNIVLNCSTGFNQWASYPTLFPKVHFENNIAWKCGANYNVPSYPKSNRAVDPKLANPARFDFHPLAGSPCLDGGFPAGLLFMMNDFAGNARVADADLDGKSLPDIGPYEKVQAGLSVSNFVQGRTATFQGKNFLPGGYPGIFFLGYAKASLVLSPFGIFGLEPAKILVGAPMTFPGKYQLPIPSNPLLKGVPVYAQALGFRPTTGGFVFMPTGRLDLYL